MDVLQEYYNPTDCMFVEYQQLLVNNEIVTQQQLTQYTEQSLKSNKKIHWDRGIEEFTVNDLIADYNIHYTKHNEAFASYFQNAALVYYYEDAEIENVLKKFARTGDPEVLHLLITETEYQTAQTELLMMNDDIQKSLITFKNRFESLQDLDLNVHSVIELYKDWLVTVNKDLQRDLAVALIIMDLHTFLLSKNTSILNSPEDLNTLTKVFKPTKLGHAVNIEDGPDIFNDAIVNAVTAFIIYKDYNNKVYYKLKKGSTLDIATLPTINANTLYFPINWSNTLTCHYDLEHNQLDVQYIQFKNTLMDDNVFTVMSGLDLGVGWNDAQSGIVNLWQVEYDEDYLLDLILNHPLLKKWVFVNNKPKYMLMKGIHLKMKPINTNVVISVNITQQFHHEAKTVQVSFDNTVRYDKLKLNKDKLIPYVSVEFKNVSDFEPFCLFIKLLLEQARITTTNTFNQLLDKWDKRAERQVDPNLVKLKNLAPDVFNEGYANFCYKIDFKRPTPIDEDDIKPYINKQIKALDMDKADAKLFRQYGVLDFTLPNNDIIHLTCQYDKERYPYLKSTRGKNKLANIDKQIIPSLPCCGTKPPKQNKQKTEHTHITTPTTKLKPQTTGNLPMSITYLLSNYNGGENAFQRVGVDMDDALIRCLCLSTNIAYQEQLKIQIVEKINCAICKQECYNQEIDDIKLDFLNSPNVDRHYRLLEAYFNVNIYVFAPIDILHLPRFDQFHARPIRNHLPTVLLYQLDNHVELIINKLDKVVPIHDAPMAQYCHTLLINRLHTLVIKSENEVYDNLYSYVDHLSIGKCVSQWIDTHGKVRAFHFDTAAGLMSLLTIPSQPENLPIDNTVHAVSLETASAVMTQPHTAQIVIDGRTVGLWYQLFDLHQGEAITITSSDILPDITVGPTHPLLLPNVQISPNDYYKVKKIMHFITQCCLWLYQLSLRAYQVVNNVEEFFKLYVVMDNIVDSQDYQSILRIPRKLPVFEEFEKHFDHVEKYCPTLVNSRKIRLYNNQFYQQIKKLMTQLDLTEPHIPHIISNYYQSITDYRIQPDTLIFLNDEQLNAYLHRRDDHIFTTIQPASDYPSIYQFEDGRLFLVQSVKTNNLNDVLYLIDYWLHNKINLGAHVIADRNIHLNPNIYKIDDGKLILVKQGTDPQYNVIDYHYRPDKTGMYWALLNLL